jgi:hypothetical protein
VYSSIVKTLFAEVVRKLPPGYLYNPDTAQDSQLSESSVKLLLSTVDN